MIKTGRKLLTSIAALALVLCMSVPAFAATSTTSTSGYGTLTGTLSSNGSYTTKVTRNNDRAYLTISGTIQNSAGSTLVTQQTISSSRGVTSFSGRWSGIPSNAYALYGAHGVQGGSTYGAAAVYTYTRA